MTTPSAGSNGDGMVEVPNQPSTAGGQYRLLEHTADMGIEAQAHSLAALFICTARGLLEILFDTPCPPPGRQRLLVALQRSDVEELLVAWLGEILFLVEQRDFCPVGFHIEELEGGRLRGSVVGEFSSGEIRPVREVKAVTYHRLRVQRHEGLWKARVYLDL